MATKLQTYNSALTRLAEDRLVALTDDNENRRKLDAVWDNTYGTLLEDGPEDGWKFARRSNIAVDRESTSITAFADYSTIVTGEVKVTTKTSHGLVSGNDIVIDSTTGYNGDHDDITFISTSEFTITATYAANDATGTVYWRSDNYRYRYKLPDECKFIKKVRVGGVEITDWFEEEGYILTNNEDETIYIDYIRDVDITECPAYFAKVVYLSLATELSYPIIKSSTHTERLQAELDRTMSWAIARDERKKYVKEQDHSWVEAGR